MLSLGRNTLDNSPPVGRIVDAVRVVELTYRDGSVSEIKSFRR
jgi:hypothetical protein